MGVRLANDLFLPDDLRAHARGWTAEPVRSGTGRSYRDPRWDRLTECDQCDGAGFRGIDACPACVGRGVLDRAATPAVEHDEPIKVTAERLDLPPGEER